MRKIDINKELQEDAIVFGNEANLSRAIPYVRDGLKPSQRAVIYTAYEKGYTSNKPHVKSLKLDGQVVGEFWPHGSEYPTICRLTQPFVQNIPLLDMHGANGSILGDPSCAASRYTEVRLSKACEDGFLNNLDKGTCNWIPNYSEDKVWPQIFPAILPNLFVNGSDGMGYCYSQTWLPGNLNEFCDKINEYLSIKKLNYTNIYPDFPTGGKIINKKDIHTIYETGSGSVILRGEARIEGKNIIITELPYQIYVSDYMEQLKSLILPDKRGVTKIPEINNVYNMSGKTGMHIEIECDKDPQNVLNKLYKYSNLQISLTANQLGIVDGIPEMVNLERYIQVYIDHNITCIKREYTYEANKTTEKLEVINGLIRAISIIDDVIATIKASKSAEAARTELVSKFEFTENQARAIVDMRLGKLANLETVELTKEKAELEKYLDKCNKLLASDKLQKKEFLTRLSEFVTKYGWERRTRVEDVDISAEEIKVEKPTEAAKTTLFMTKAGYLKRVETGDFKPAKINTDENKVVSAFETGEKDRFITISDAGMMYKVEAKRVAMSNMNALGTDISDQLNGEKPVNILPSEAEKEFVFMVTTFGRAKKMKTDEILGLSRVKGTPVIKLNEGETLILCQQVDANEQIALNASGKTFEIDTGKYSPKGRMSGPNSCIKLKKGQTLA